MGFSKAKKNLQKYGFVKIDDFFSPSEILELRKAVESYDKIHGLNSGVCTHSTGLFNAFYKSENLKNLLHELLGSNAVFWGEATANKTETEGKTGIPEGHGVFHKDNTDRSDQNAPDWQSEFTIFRFGIYLDNYTDSSGGIGFRKYSHKRSRFRRLWNKRILVSIVHLLDILLGRSVYSRSKPGDLVIWYLTTDHAGNCKYLRLNKNRPSSKFTKPLIPDFLWSKTNNNQRITMFTTFGKKDHHLERHLKLLKRRNYMVEAWEKTKYSESQLKDKTYPFETINMPGIIQKEKDDNELEPIGEDWVAIPY